MGTAAFIATAIASLYFVATSLRRPKRSGGTESKSIASDDDPPLKPNAVRTKSSKSKRA